MTATISLSRRIDAAIKRVAPMEGHQRAMIVGAIVEELRMSTDAKPHTREQFVAIREAHLDNMQEQYFVARPHLDNPANRRIYYGGFCHGYDVKDNDK